MRIILRLCRTASDSRSERVVFGPAFCEEGERERTRRSKKVEEHARYVYEAVDGRRVKSGEETSIPIPRSDDGVEELLDALDEDREKVESTDIDALEAEIDEAVYDLFDLDESEREVIEEYLEVF